MTDPLKIMDEIERDEISIFHEGRWQSLRTAIEAQAEELAQIKHMAAQLYQAAGAYDMPERVLDVLSDMASGDPLRHKNILPVQSPETDEELTQARARIAKLERAHGKGVSKFTYSRPDGSIVTDGDALVRSVTGGMGDKVIPLDCVTRLDLPVDRVLDQAKERLTGAVILGYDEDGEYYFASTFADGGDVLWLLEKCKQRLLEES